MVDCSHRSASGYPGTFFKQQLTGPIPKDLFSDGLGEPRYQYLTSPTGHSNMPTGVKTIASQINWKAGEKKGLHVFYLLNVPDNKVLILAFGPSSIIDFNL